MASAILKFLRSNIFPIINVKAYKVLFAKKTYMRQYTIAIYMNYADEIYRIRDQTDLSPDKVDEQLYAFDKKHNGKL
ncbi:MAG: hypothetical protein ABIC95_05945 [archaeon]